MKAIDLYAGIGGWTLGLQMAGVETVASYEWWERANETHRLNFDSAVHQVDIRALSATAVPMVDFVVGSPPCTQFSFANRGGSGNIEDGLADIRKFLEVVAAVQPRQWAMENVPRVAGILRRELAKGGRLSEYQNLVPVITVVNSADYGVPQNRKRMIAGDFPVDLLEGYRHKLQRRTLGQVLSALDADPVLDPIYGLVVPRELLTANEHEEPLDWEETRMNREAKSHHPVYNRMSFPDTLDRPARTVTATCTRVSRESIVIRDGARYRRLSIRERASLQTFPVTFQFDARSYGDCLRMTGNAVPPLLTYYIASAMLGVSVDAIGPPTLDDQAMAQEGAPRVPPPDAPKHRHLPTRRFRMAIPGLRFGSGVRFELANWVDEGETKWRVNFYFGTSKRIEKLDLDSETWSALFDSESVRTWLSRSDDAFERASRKVDEAGSDLQRVWTGAESGRHPFEVVDALGELASTLVDRASNDVDEYADGWVTARLASPGNQAATPKLRGLAPQILAGCLIGSWFNLGQSDLFVYRGQPAAVGS